MISTIRLLVFVAFTSTTIATAFACEWEETLAHILEHQSVSSPFSTLAELNTLIERCPNAPRLVLEKGTLLSQLNRYEEAINQWQQALHRFELPETVALKVKLKILDAQQKKQDQWQHYLFARGSWQTQSNEDQHYATVSVQGKTTYHYPAIKLFNRPAFSEIFAGYGALVRQPLISNVSEPNATSLLMFQIGGAINWQQWKLPLQLNLNLVNEDPQFSLTSTPRYKWRKVEVSTHFDYDLNESELEIEPKVRGKWANFSLAASAVHEKQWQTLKASISTGTRWGIELAGEYDLELDEYELGGEVFYRITPDVRVTLNADTILSEPSYWKTKASLVWKVY